MEELLPGRMLRLRAEMRLPGLAWLELGVRPGRTGTVYRQRAVFHPRGLAGQLYWWSIKPFHGLVFGAMARNLTRRAMETGPAASAAAAAAARGRDRPAPRRLRSHAEI